MPQGHREVPLGKGVLVDGKTLRQSFEEKKKFNGDHGGAGT